MMTTTQSPARAATVAPALAFPKARRRARDYFVPPIVVPLALSVVLLIYMLVRGPA